MRQEESEALKKINESVDDMIGKMMVNMIDYLDWDAYYQEYKKLKRLIKTIKSPSCESILKTITIKLAIALRDAQVLLKADYFESSYNSCKKELLTDLNDARKVLA